MTHGRLEGSGVGWRIRRERPRWRSVLAAAPALALVVVLGGCTLFGGSSTTTGTQSERNLAQLAWCDKPLVEFQDDGTTAQTTLTHWDDVKGQLGFTPYLPDFLPTGTCLVVAGGSIHDPIYGGHFSITYDLPATGPLSFSEAPKRPNLDTSFQCTQSAPASTPTPQTGTPSAQSGITRICLGVVSGTSISIASRQSQDDLKTLFNSLQANVSWVPASTETVQTTPTATVTAAPSATASGG
jgi:hypothetical protein